MAQLCELPKIGVALIIPQMNIDMLIGKNLKRIREKHNFSQSQLAEAIGTTPQRLSAYETGRDGMGKDYMERICKALKIEPWEFYVSDKTPIVQSASEQRVLELWREAEALGVAEEVAKYEAFRIDEAKKKGSTGNESASKRVPRSRVKKSA